MNKKIYNQANPSVKRSIYIAAFGTLLISSFWGLYFKAPAPIKGFFSICMWVSIFSVPLALIRENDFYKSANFLLKVLLLMAVFQIVRSALNTAPDMYAFGNKWVTLFGNEYTALLLMPPIFTYMGTLSNSIVTLKNATYYYLAIGALFSIFLQKPLAFLIIFIGVFYPFVNKKYKFLIFFAAITAIVKATVGENPSRMLLIILAFSIASYVLVYILKKVIYIKIFVLLVIASPSLFFLPLLKASVSDDESNVFQKAQEYVIGKTGNEDLANDTRTFLYLEMASDLTNTNSWLLGKGAYSHYYSYFFDETNLGRYGRISSEVPLLTFLLRGGILYALAYFSLLILAIYYAVWKGKNKFVRSIAIIVSGWYFNSFIGDITGCRFYHLAFFLLLGCCFSKKWLNYTDKDIKMILKK